MGGELEVFVTYDADVVLKVSPSEEQQENTSVWLTAQAARALGRNLLEAADRADQVLMLAESIDAIVAEE